MFDYFGTSDFEIVLVQGNPLARPANLPARNDDAACKMHGVFVDVEPYVVLLRLKLRVKSSY
jgi:hypothetical protein